MSAVNNLGGFVAPSINAPHDQPLAIRPSDTPIDLAAGPAESSTNPFSPSFSASSTNSRSNPLDVGYPDYAPPSYDSVASTSLVPTPTLEKGGASLGFGPTSIATQSAQPQQFLLNDNSHSSDLARGSSTKKAQYSEPEYPIASSSTLVIRAQPGILTRDQSLNKVTRSRNPLDPLPACFSRVVLPPSETVTYERLPQPFVIHGKPGKKFLDDAFTVTPIPAFRKHDVEADDWVRFLDNVVTAARFNGGQKAVAAALPVTSHLLLIGRLASKAVEYGMKKQNVSSVVGVLAVWNEQFFHYRRLSVVLCKGDYRYSGFDRDLPAPDRPNVKPRSKGHEDEDSSSSSSSESDDDDKSSHSRRDEKRIRRAERREQRRARREERRGTRDDRRHEKKAKKRESYRLVVVSTN